MSNTGILKSSLAKKYVMALTGLFLCLFLAGHLAGNLQLLLKTGEAGQQAFNEYAEFMTTFPLVKLLSYLTYASVLFHVIDGIVLSMQNRKARPVGYGRKIAANAKWPPKHGHPRNHHLGLPGQPHANLLVQMHFGAMPMHNGLKDLHTVVAEFFSPDNSIGLIAVVGYVLAQAALAFHLSHGFQSGFQSLGFRHAKYTPVIEKAGMAFALLVPALFAAIPVFLYITQL